MAMAKCLSPSSLLLLVLLVGVANGFQKFSLSNIRGTTNNDDFQRRLQKQSARLSPISFLEARRGFDSLRHSWRHSCCNNENSTGREENTRIIVRDLQEEDIPDVIRMCVKEWGPFSAKESSFSLFPKFLQRNKTTNYLDNIVLAWIIGLALYQRLYGRLISPGDHQVLVLVRSSSDHAVLGAAELSQQPIFQTSSPLCLPLPIKQSIANDVVPYVSNVIIQNSHRGKGLGRLLMKAVEARAVSMQFDQLTLHVNTKDERAVSFYNHLGFQTIPEMQPSYFSAWWNRIFRFALGLYFINDVPLSYLQKHIAGNVTSSKKTEEKETPLSILN